MELEPYQCNKEDHNFNKKPKNMKQYAYVTLLLKDDSFLVGCMTLAYTLRKQKTKADLIVMVTPDISKSARKTLKIIYDHVYEVPYIYANKEVHRIELVKRFPQYQYTFTKFNLFKFTQYTKLIYIDADAISIKYFDHLFTLDPPAAVYYGYRGKDTHMIENNYKPKMKGNKYFWHEQYCECCEHGKLIDPIYFKDIGLNNNFIGISSELMVLKPNIETYKNILKLTKHKVENKRFSTDTGIFTYYFRNEWTGIDPRFAGYRGYPTEELLFGVQMGGGIKPWEKPLGKWPESKIWYKYFIQMMQKYKIKVFKKLLKKVLNQNPREAQVEPC
jgi:alpha-N-acetylglucosamine transferase